MTIEREATITSIDLAIDTSITDRRISIDSSTFRPNSIETGYINDSWGSVWINPMDSSRPTLTTNNTKNDLNEGNLIFVDMKIENKGNKNMVVMTYIDNKNFKEIKRSFDCDIVFEKTALLSLADIDKITFNYKITNTSEIIETSKDI